MMYVLTIQEESADGDHGRNVHDEEQASRILGRGKSKGQRPRRMVYTAYAATLAGST